MIEQYVSFQEQVTPAENGAQNDCFVMSYL